MSGDSAPDAPPTARGPLGPGLRILGEIGLWIAGLGVLFLIHRGLGPLFPAMSGILRALLHPAVLVGVAVLVGLIPTAPPTIVRSAAAMPKTATVRAAVIEAPGAPVTLREFVEPVLEPDSALLQVDYSEVCGTDVHLQQGLLSGVPYPLIPGHVSVGRLARIRGRLRDVAGQPLAEGDEVTFLDVHRTCNACWYCLVAKATTRCPERKVYGITYGAADGLAGGWAERIHLKAGTHVVPLRGADPRAFMAGGCGLPTALHAMDRADIAIGDSVLVLGAGPVGLAAAILARLRGAVQVLVIGAPEQRLQTARAVGASDVLDFRHRPEAERIEWVRAHTEGRGADVTIEATGAPDAVVDAMRCTRDAGRVVVVGQYTDHGNASFNPHLDLNRKHLEIRASWGSDYSHFHRAVQIMRDRDLAAPFTRFPLQEFPLDRAAEALAAVAAGTVVKALIRPAADRSYHRPAAADAE